MYTKSSDDFLHKATAAVKIYLPDINLSSKISVVEKKNQRQSLEHDFPTESTMILHLKPRRA